MNKVCFETKFAPNVRAYYVNSTDTGFSYNVVAIIKSICSWGEGKHVEYVLNDGVQIKTVSEEFLMTREELKEHLKKIANELESEDNV
ncbi:MAG: hypothetical protein ACOC5T_08080 [Elusimicrobiota bacterium]